MENGLGAVYTQNGKWRKDAKKYEWDSGRCGQHSLSVTDGIGCKQRPFYALSLSSSSFIGCCDLRSFACQEIMNASKHR